jgi:L-aspartate oxidase
MEKDGTDYVWEDLRTIPEEELMNHFPNIVEHCRQMGYDVTKECIPVVPAQHYFMGGVWVDHDSKTSMDRLYAVGETACNGVHGRNRLASNSLLESLVFAKRAAQHMTQQTVDTLPPEELFASVPLEEYKDRAILSGKYHECVREAIVEADRKMQQSNERESRRKATVAFRKKCRTV